MYCNKCGANVPEGVSFCPNCGASVSASSGNQKRKGISVRNVLIIVTLLLLAIGYVNHQSVKQEEQRQQQAMRFTGVWLNQVATDGGLTTYSIALAIASDGSWAIQEAQTGNLTGINYGETTRKGTWVLVGSDSIMCKRTDVAGEIYSLTISPDGSTLKDNNNGSIFTYQGTIEELSRGR